MQIPGLDLDLQRLAAPLPIWRADVDRAQWRTAAASVAQSGGRLVALWGLERAGGAPQFAVAAAYALRDGLAWLELRLPMEADGDMPAYPDISRFFPAALRMERAAGDLLGMRAEGLADTRPWLDHGQWPAGTRPLRAAAAAPAAAAAAGASLADAAASYPFVRVEGDGVHEIAVGPVHAGIIEPGHFRFSVVGEKLLRLEQRLGYTHKGIERRFTQLDPLQAHRLAGRVSGDSTVAFSWAYCMAVESVAGCVVSPRADRLRALMLERERVANHLGDLGALGNDAGFALALAQFSRLREDWLRLSKDAFGHRLMMDCVIPGGVVREAGAGARTRMHSQCEEIEVEVRRLAEIFQEHAGLQDRFSGAGRVSPELAAQLGLTGLAGRASSQLTDLRCDHSWRPYADLEVRMAGHRSGDVAARVEVRFEETLESLRLIRLLCENLADEAGEACTPMTLPSGPAFGAGWVEGWRGEVLVALELDEAGAIRRCHCHDPSWQNWPVLEHAVMGNIVPDFPLINKSFNLSYSGHDL